MPFDPNKHLIKVNGGRQYLPVAPRLIWFRMEHPDWGIETQAIEVNSDKKYAIFQATIRNEEGRIIAQATKREDAVGFPDYVEKSETGSVGRALAMCGYGTQFAPDFEEGGRYADSPQPTSAQRQNNGTQRTAQGGNPQRPPQGTQKPQGGACTTPGCGAVLTAAQVTASQHKFGKDLCLECQRATASHN